MTTKLKTEEINEKLMDNKMILRMKENVVREHFEKLYKSSKVEVDAETVFTTKLKTKRSETLSRKRQQRKKSKSKRLHSK
jgi:hypothetical protein